MDSDKSGFYCRTTESSKEHTKYDQNKAYKSFSKSGLFNGFPILEATFTINKSFSEMYVDDEYQDVIDDMFGCDCDGKCEFCLSKDADDNSFILEDFDINDDDLHKEVIKDLKIDTSKYDEVPLLEKDYKHGLLYIEWETLTTEKLNNKLYYEGNGWYPIEIVKEYYNKYNINPYVKSYAYASETFNVDFTNFTNDQFRTFLGKCISASFDEVWRTKDYLEFMRARYILRERIVSFTCINGVYQIVYASDKKPWNMPVISSYIKAHQKYNLFEQYNKLIDANITPVAVSVDGIEVKEPCDHLFDIGTKNGQWKHEEVKAIGAEPSVIERDTVEPKGEVEFSKDLLLPKYLHISGAGGNGKSEYIVKLARAYPGLMYMAPTNDAVKNLFDRAKQLNININATTYHKVFGFGCEDRFPRNKYNRFILDECSMLSAENLKTIMNKLNPTQSLLMAGDFCQLPCIEETPIYDNWTHEKSIEYEKFEVKELTKNWRQKEDAEFYSLCNSLRGELNEDKAKQILKVLNSRVLPLPENTTLDDIHICGINAQVDKINNSYKLEVGCKIICNMGCNDKEGNYIPNGSLGVVENMNPFTIKWANNTHSEFKGVGKTNSKKPRFTPAYGLTIHKAQGKTIKRNVIINPSRLFSKNHLYVALTRATKFSSIYLTEPMSFNVFCKTVHVKDFKTPYVSYRLQNMVNKYMFISI